MLSIEKSIEAVVEAWVEQNEHLVQEFLDDAVESTLTHNELVEYAREACGEIMEDSCGVYEVAEAMKEQILDRLS